MTPGTVLFLILALIAVASAIGMLTSANAVHAALFLVINFFCIALFYLGLHAPFLAMVQITVYAGAIMVLFLFVIMLLGAERISLGSTLRWQGPLAIVLVVLLLGVTIFILFSPQIGSQMPVPEVWTAAQAAGDAEFGSPASVGLVLFERYLLPFQMVGILLLVAMIGAVVLTRDELKTGRKRREAQTAVSPDGQTGEVGEA
ncbi:MAG: NADH-quinone oxidoreductase subunit J [Anaerolineae bacterium]|nr:NADH-quinone oxidoreductase subunit J [Anaerolineae bacterium]